MQWCEHLNTLDSLADILSVICQNQATVEVVIQTGSQEQLVNALVFLIENEDTGRSQKGSKTFQCLIKFTHEVWGNSPEYALAMASLLN